VDFSSSIDLGDIYSSILIYFFNLQIVEINSDLLQSMMSSLLNNVLAEDCRNQWSMSRPLLVLILLYEDYYR